MTAVLFVIAAFVVGLFGGALVSAARDYGVKQAEDDVYRNELVRQWREGYAHGFTTGRVQLVGEQQARRMHPTGSPESVLKALDAEADRRMRELD
jgi:hypothetical protein